MACVLWDTFVFCESDNYHKEEICSMKLASVIQTRKYTLQTFVELCFLTLTLADTAGGSAGDPPYQVSFFGWGGRVDKGGNQLLYSTMQDFC